MSEAKVDGVDQPKDQASGEISAEQKQDKVAYETYRKTLDEAKKAKAKADELAKTVKAYEDEKLQTQGKSQELIESLRSQVKEKEEKLQNVVGSFAYKAVSSQLREEAAKQGCLDVDLLLKASSDEFSKIEVDAENGFSVNQDDMKRFFETTVSKHPMLFKKSAPKFHDASPNNGTVNATKDFSKMNSAELLDAYKKLSLKGLN